MTETEQIEAAFRALAAYGVPQARARTIANGIGVLVTRMQKESDFNLLGLSRFVTAAQNLLSLIDDVGSPELAQTDRVFAQFEFDELREVLEAYKNVNTFRLFGYKEDNQL